MNNPKAGPGTSIDFFKSLADELNLIGAMTGRAELSNANVLRADIIESSYSKHIDSIHFYSSLVLVKTK